jgi:hypothetical protein
VELENRGSEPVDLAGLRLEGRGAGDVALPAATLAPGERRAVPAAIGAGNHLVLLDARGRMVATFEAPGYPGAGLSLNRDGAPLDRDARWTAAPATPGQ